MSKFALAFLLAASAAPAMAQGVVPARPALPPALVCSLNPRPFGPGEARITNIGGTPVEAGRAITVTVIQASAVVVNYPMQAVLPPGGSISLPLTGASLLARGCVATAQ